MSLTFRIHHVLGPREGPAESLSPRDQQKARALGLTSATGLVVGSITGTGVGIALIGLWVPAAVNLAGVRQMAWLQDITVMLKFLPQLLGHPGWGAHRRRGHGADDR